MSAIILNTNTWAVLGWLRPEGAPRRCGRLCLKRKQDESKDRKLTSFSVSRHPSPLALMLQARRSRMAIFGAVMTQDRPVIPYHPSQTYAENRRATSNPTR
jgi:hypothetical protein